MFTTDNTNLSAGTLLYTKNGAKTSCQIIADGEEINLDPCYGNKFSSSDKPPMHYAQSLKMCCSCSCGDNSCDEGDDTDMACACSVQIGETVIEADDDGKIDITEVLDACLNSGLLVKLADKVAEV